MIELDGAMSMRKASVKSGGFVRYPFQLISLGSIKLTDNKYLIVRMREELKDSNDKVTGDMDDVGVHGKKSSLTDKRKKKRYIVDDCDSALHLLLWSCSMSLKKSCSKCFADSLAAADDESGFGYADHAGLPLTLANIIGTTHTLEMKSHTYYEHGTFESFTCWRIAPEEVVDIDSESSNMNTSAEVKRLASKPFVTTPSKPTEEKVKKEELKDSNDEVTGDMDDGGVDGKKSSLTDKRKKK
nr:hypothetical protein [Tanacetum cinerariifolium]